MDGDTCPSDTIKPEKCQKNNCINDTTEQTLLCSSCKKRVHFRCSLLPSYQLQRYITFGKGHSSYICESCVKVPQYLQKYSVQEVFNEQERKRSERFEKEIFKLKEVIQKKETEIRKARDALQKMSDISLPPTHIFSKQQKRRRINDENANVAQVVEKTNEEAGNGKIIEKLTKLCDTLSERLSEREIALNGANQILNDTENPLSESSKTKTLNNIEESLPKQFDALQANLIKIINEKCKFARKKESKEPLSYAETTTSHLPLNKSSQKQSSVDNFRSIMMATAEC